MKFHSKPPKKQKGFLLLEVVLALGIFAMACTGLAIAFQRMAQSAQLAQSELRIIRILDSAIIEQLSMPTFEEGITQTIVPGTDIELDIEIAPLLELENEQGQLLQEMYHIHITANWFENGQWQTRTAETWRNALMYQP